jgi:acyl dehydratase
MTEEFLTNKAYTTEIPHLSDVKNYIGKEMGLSGWSTITQEQINNFGF